MNAVVLDNVTLGYDRHPAVHHVTARIAHGSLTALVGPNGGGKSTLLKGIVGELTPRTGVITAPPRAAVAYLPQLSQIDRSFPVSVFELVAMGLWGRIGAFGAVGRREHAEVTDALGRVGLEGFDRRPIEALSGGQVQRVLFARLLLQDARLILLDEPFAAVDRRTVEDLLSIIEAWHAQGRTVIAVLHDVDLVVRHFPDAMLLARELLAHGPSNASLSAEAMRRARTVSEAFDEGAPVCRRAA